jgi:hypothetical protein
VRLHAFCTDPRATLVARLDSAETTGLAPPVPPVSRVLRAEAKARAQRTRAYATPSAPVAAAAQEEAVKPVITTADLPVNAPAAEVKVSEPTAAEKTSAPGLPVRKPLASDAFTIYFPDPTPDKEAPQVIVSRDAAAELRDVHRRSVASFDGWGWVWCLRTGRRSPRPPLPRSSPVCPLTSAHAPAHHHVDCD